MTVYRPGEVNIQELLQRQHEKYGKKMVRGYEYVTTKNQALEMGKTKRKANKLAAKAVKRLDKHKNV